MRCNAEATRQQNPDSADERVFFVLSRRRSARSQDARHGGTGVHPSGLFCHRRSVVVVGLVQAGRRASTGRSRRSACRSGSNRTTTSSGTRSLVGSPKALLSMEKTHKFIHDLRRIGSGSAAEPLGVRVDRSPGLVIHVQVMPEGSQLNAYDVLFRDVEAYHRNRLSVATRQIPWLRSDALTVFRFSWPPWFGLEPSLSTSFQAMLVGVRNTNIVDKKLPIGRSWAPCTSPHSGRSGSCCIWFGTRRSARPYRGRDLGIASSL